MRLEDLRPSSPAKPTEFEQELIEVLPFSAIPNFLHAREVVEFFIEKGWTPPAGGL